MTGPEAQIAEPITAEVTVLGALEDQRWRTSVAIVDHTQLLAFAVRFTLKELVGGGLVRRDMIEVRSGHWQITASGVVQVHRQRVTRQLR